MPNWLGSVLVAATLAALSVSPKLWLQRHSAQVDGNRLNQDIAARLAAGGFQVALDPDLSVPAIRGMRGNCRIVVRNGDRDRELQGIFDLEEPGYGPVVIGYRHRWARHPAAAGAVMERFAQDGLARVGIKVARPAVIALAATGPCAGTRAMLDGIEAHAFLKDAMPQSED